MSKIATFAALSLLVAVGILAVGTAYSEAGVPHTVENETITQTVPGETTVDAPDAAIEFFDNETVNNSSDVTLVEGTDYDWNTSTGTITWYDTESTTDGADATISYAYLAPTDRTQALAGVLYYGGYTTVLVVLLGGAGLVVSQWLGVG